MMNSNPVEIPWERLSPDALQRVIELFVLREGTDYGRHEFSLDQKVSQVRRQLETGKAVLTYDPQLESCSIILKDR